MRRPARRVVMRAGAQGPVRPPRRAPASVRGRAPAWPPARVRPPVRRGRWLRGCGRWPLCLADVLPGRCRRLGVHRRLARGQRDVQPGLDAFDALQQRRLGVAGRRQQQPRAHHLEQQARGGRPAHLTEPGVHHLGVAGQRGRTDPGGLVARIRSSTSSGASTTPRLAASGTACSTIRSRKRSNRSVANRRGSWPASITDSTAPNRAAASPAARASTASSISATSVAPSRASARW